MYAIFDDIIHLPLFELMPSIYRHPTVLFVYKVLVKPQFYFILRISILDDLNEFAPLEHRGLEFVPSSSASYT